MAELLSSARAVGRMVLSAPARRPAPSAKLVAAAFETRSQALRTLVEHDALMRRSHHLLERSRALCATSAEMGLWPARPAPRTERARAEARPATAAARSCARRGCRNAALFRPVFMVGANGRRVAVPKISLLVCAEHRAELLSLLRKRKVLLTLRRMMKNRGGARPTSLRVAFQTMH